MRSRVQVSLSLQGKRQNVRHLRYFVSAFFVAKMQHLLQQKRLSLKGGRSIYRLVTPRRGTHEGGERVELLCPDVGVFRCLSFVAERLYSVVVRDVARVVSARYINKGRSPQNCIERGCVSAWLSDAILRDDELICFAYANKIGARLGGSVFVVLRSGLAHY